MSVRVLVVHNHYQQPGGEDQVFRAEADLLHDHGHEVQQYSEHNQVIDGRNKLQLAVETVWSERSRSRLAGVLAEFRPDVAHFHNTFPLISPSAYYACRRARVPIVQTLHNYRVACANAIHFRDNQVCHQCRGKLVGWRGVAHACYRQSRTATAAIVAMNAAHRLVGTWTDAVDTYIALSQFARASLIANGLPARKIVVKGNFVPGEPRIGGHDGRFGLFVGRLTPEKGIMTLLEAWRRLRVDMPLKIVGDGPLAEAVMNAARSVPGIQWLGALAPAETLELMGECTFLVVPSEWDEPFGLVAIEAFARGTPVIAAAAGALPEIVEHEHSGLLYEPGHADQLTNRVEWLVQHPQVLATLGAQARQTFDTRYTAERNYEALIAIYQQLIATV